MRIALLVSALAACGDSGPTDSMPRDQGLEPVTPPDIPIYDGGVSANIGAPCDPKNGDKDCKPGAECLDLSGGKAVTCDLQSGKGCGVCVLVGCTLEDLETPAVEDTCPKGTVCTVLPVVSGTDKFCLKGCTPRLDKNPCAELHAGLTCHPASIVLTGHSEVCIYPACAADQDCGNKDPLKPDSTCLLPSGMCVVNGDPQAKVGDPCIKSADCGPYQSCLVEQKDTSGATILEGGYCTKIGCKYADVLVQAGQPKRWECPADSECFYMGSGTFVSFCLDTTCDPTKPDDADDCRDEASPGQYDCIEQGANKLNVCWRNLK